MTTFHVPCSKFLANISYKGHVSISQVYESIHPIFSGQRTHIAILLLNMNVGGARQNFINALICCACAQLDGGGGSCWVWSGLAPRAPSVIHDMELDHY